MSRIGNLPILIPDKVVVAQNGNVVVVKGPKAELSQEIRSLVITVEVKENKLFVKRLDNEKHSRALHGLYRALIQNMVVGVSIGHKKELELVGVGYRVTNSGNLLDFSLGYSHNIYLQLPPEIKVEIKVERNKNALMLFESADKQLLGQICAKIRSFRKTEPYKGKGIKFLGEIIRRKSGKTGKSGKLTGK